MPKVVVYDRKRLIDDFLKVDETSLSYERFDGSMSPRVRRLCVERGDSAAAVLYHPERKRLVLVNQFKYPTYDKGPGWITEIVAGVVDSGETFEQAVRREVLEETGYVVQKLQHIRTFYVSPGGSSERIALFYGQVVNSARPGPGGGADDECEDIQTIELSLEEALIQVEQGAIVDAKTLLGILWFKEHGTEIR